MLIHSGQDASIEFQQRLRFLKNSRLYWCAVTIAWKGADVPRWVSDTSVMAILQDRLLKTLAAEHEKVCLLVLASGDLVVLAETLTNAAYQRVKSTLQALLMELGVQDVDGVCASYDLSVDWDAFVVVCREMYGRAGAISERAQVADKNAMMLRLMNELKAAAGAIAVRDVKPAKLHLLFVEDEPMIRQLLNNLLAESGHILSFAATGKEAVEMYARKPPQMVFLDINLPDISGLEVLELIAKHDKRAHVVMLTSGAGQEQVRTAVQQGVKGYVVKPFSRQKLTECVERYYAG